MKTSSVLWLAVIAVCSLSPQAIAQYVRVFEVCLENPRVKGIKLWGVVDDTDWKSKKPYRPYLFDAQGRAKPAFFAVRDALANASRDAQASHRSNP